MEHLDITGLEEAMENKKGICWHPDYHKRPGASPISGAEMATVRIIRRITRYKTTNSISTMWPDGSNIQVVDVNNKGLGTVSSAPVFVLASNVSGGYSMTAPKNNDGRELCFWCPGINTVKRGGGMYDVCPKCGR